MPPAPPALRKIALPVVVDAVPSVSEAPCTVNVPVKLAVVLIVWPLIRPEVMVPILTRFPLASIRAVPAPAPLLILVVPFTTVPVIVFAVAIVPKPDAILPTVNAPVPVIAVVTTSFVSTKGASLPSSLLNSVAVIVCPFTTKVELEPPVTVKVPVLFPIFVAAVPELLMLVAPMIVRPAKLGAAEVAISCTVLTAPEVTVKLVALKLAIPLATSEALSIVTVAPLPLELANVKTPVKPSKDVTPPPAPPVQDANASTPLPLLTKQSLVLPAVVGRVKLKLLELTPLCKVRLLLFVALRKTI